MFTRDYVVADNDVTIAGRARAAATRRCHWLPVFCYLNKAARTTAIKLK